VSGSSGPNAFSRIATARSTSCRASTTSPWARMTSASTLRVSAIAGCSGPNTFSRIASCAFAKRPRPRRIALSLNYA
jgi:hypothetical protein